MGMENMPKGSAGGMYSDPGHKYRPGLVVCLILLFVLGIVLFLAMVT